MENLPVTIVFIVIGDLKLSNSYLPIKSDDIGLYVPCVGYLRRNISFFVYLYIS